MGHRVLGIDRTACYLDIGRKKALASGVPVSFELGDVRTFRREKAFDGAVSMFSSFGYFEDPQDDIRLLENVVASLRPGGKLVMDLLGKEVIARSFTSRSWSEPEPGLLWLEERRVLPGWSAIENKWTLVKGDQKREHVLTIRMYSGSELAAVFSRAGFSRVELFGSIDGGPYDPTARRRVAVGVR